MASAPAERREAEAAPGGGGIPGVGVGGEQAPGAARLTCAPEGRHRLPDGGLQAEGPGLGPVPQHGELPRDVVHGQRVGGVLRGAAGREVSRWGDTLPQVWRPLPSAPAPTPRCETNSNSSSSLDIQMGRPKRTPLLTLLLQRHPVPSRARRRGLLEP